MIIIAAGMMLVLGVSATFNPSFAQWIGGLFATDQVDEGLRMATDAGLVERVNLEVVDNGISFKVEDIVIDSSRVALSYQILNQNGKPLNTHLGWPTSKNEIYAVDQDGKRLDSLGVGMGWQADRDYGLLEISLRENPSIENFTIKIDLVELNRKKGNWELEIPVNVKENMKYTTILPLHGMSTTHHGVTAEMKEIRFSPSSYELLYETRFSKEKQSEVAQSIQQLEDKYGDDIVHSFTNYGTALQYHIEDENMETVYAHNSVVNGQLQNMELLQGSGHDVGKLGHIAWNESFIPQKNDGKMTFVLDGVIETVPTDFSITFKPKEVRNNSVSFEYEGHYMTIKTAKIKGEYSLRKSFVPIKRETVFTVKIVGGKEEPTSDLGAWVIVDEKGKPYMTYESKSILYEKDKHGRYKTTIELTSYDIDDVPEEITLHLLSVTRYHELKNKWRVPLYK